MTDNTQSELDELLNDYLNACIYEQGTAWEQEEKIAEAEQAILDWHNKQVEALLDNIEASINNHTTPYERDLLTRSYVRNTLNFERNKLKESK